MMAYLLECKRKNILMAVEHAMPRVYVYNSIVFNIQLFDELPYI